METPQVTPNQRLNSSNTATKTMADTETMLSTLKKARRTRSSVPLTNRRNDPRNGRTEDWGDTDGPQIVDAGRGDLDCLSEGICDRSRNHVVENIGPKNQNARRSS